MLESLFAATGVEFTKLILDKVLNLTTSALEKYVQEFFKGCLDLGVSKLNSKTLQPPMAAALGGFIELFLNELKNNTVDEAILNYFYKETVRKFVRDYNVASILGKAFQKDCEQINYEELSRIWKERYQDNKWNFPEKTFKWCDIGTVYVREVQGIILADPELRAIFTSSRIDDIATNTNENKKNTSNIKENVAKIANILTTNQSNSSSSSLEANGDEQRYASSNFFMSFTKGLPHDPDTGLLGDSQDFVDFRRAINDGSIELFSKEVRHGAMFEILPDRGVVPDPSPSHNFRQWEAPTGGLVYGSKVSDIQTALLPPAPSLRDERNDLNWELVYEMAELYELAILRDQPLNYFEEGNSCNYAIDQAIHRLNELPYIKEQGGRPRKVNSNGIIDVQNIFRGTSSGVNIGPYLSQFLLMGNVDWNGSGNISEGIINSFSLQTSQKVPVAEPGINYMVNMADYVTVQRGIRPEVETYVTRKDVHNKIGEVTRAKRRFISTPRDLATYVHYDFYGAYLNACQILLNLGAPFDSGFEHLSGVGNGSNSSPDLRRKAGGYSLFGGPHILNLVTAVGTHEQKAIQFQKFNTHMRLRPEALAARLELVRIHKGGVFDSSNEWIPPELLTNFLEFEERLSPTLQSNMDGPGSGTYFLPMAYPEGSPMHPSYGSRYATVAGICVTLLKGFFDTSTTLVQTSSGRITFKRIGPGDVAIGFRAPKLDSNGDSDKDLELFEASTPLTLEHELNKLADNISIGRMMAGVNFFSDYYEGLRMGEKIAMEILKEQVKIFSTPSDKFRLSLSTFDGNSIRIDPD